LDGTSWKWRWGRRAALLVPVLAVVGVLGSPPELPGTMGVMSAELRVGMSRDKAVDVVRERYREGTWDDRPARIYVRGRTHDGREISSFCDWEFEKLPPADQIEWAELDVDDDWRDLIIRLGPGGVVSRIWLESHSNWEALRYNLSFRIGG
jgi:hypothetical protein